ncbi:leucine-rich repeat-containing protein 15-like [Bactrocera dorsalis]|uniref:Leucine-rich repeat-containing protein 15-like n=1 Tax=Bactrocera dorsalis TaxID=27457 RepID=A0ABM3J0V6_BACDO|nr:leucine-rich repeat-containing protein 15-like [Bactrocera dorsalis]
MNELKVRNLCIILAYILSQLIINNKFSLAQNTEMKLIKTTVEPVSTWPPDCFKDEKTNCECSGKHFHCNIVDGLNYIYITFGSDLRRLIVTCPINTKTNINYLLQHKFQSILLKTRYFQVINCKNFLHDNYMNDKVQRIQIKMRKPNKITLVYNTDLAAEPTLYIGDVLHLQLIFKSNRNEIRETDIMNNIIFMLNKLETLTLNVQGLTNQYLSLQNLTQTFFEKFTALRQLDLAGNNMEMLGANIFAELTKLNCLNLSRNEVRELPEGLFEYQPQLLILDLSDNLLTYLTPHIFDHTPWLWQLKLGGNQLHDTTNLMENLKPLHYLHRLDVSQNQLQTIWSTETSVNRTPRLLAKFQYTHKSMSLALASALKYITKLHPENYEGGKTNLINTI